MANETEQQYQVIYQEDGQGPFYPLGMQGAYGDLIRKYQHNRIAVAIYCRKDRSLWLNDRVQIVPASYDCMELNKLGNAA